MKFLRVQITDALHQRLKALCDHQGELSNIVRKAVREYVTKEEIKLADTKTQKESPNA